MTDENTKHGPSGNAPGPGRKFLWALVGALLMLVAEESSLGEIFEFVLHSIPLGPWVEHFLIWPHEYSFLEFDPNSDFAVEGWLGPRFAGLHEGAIVVVKHSMEMRRYPGAPNGFGSLPAGSFFQISYVEPVLRHQACGRSGQMCSYETGYYRVGGVRVSY